MMKKKILFLLKCLFGGALLLYLVFFQSKPGEIMKVFRRADILLLALSFSLHSIGLWISIIRWKIILDEQDSPYTFFQLLRTYMISIFFGHFLPTRFGGDIVRIADTRTLREGAPASLAVIGYERLSGFLILTLFALVSSLMQIRLIGRYPVLYLSLGISILALAAVFLLWFVLPRGFLSRRTPSWGPWKKAASALDRIHSVMLDFLLNRRLIRRVLGWSLLLQLNVILHYYLIGKALHVDRIPFLDYFFTIPILLFFLTIPISINGMGVREWILIRFFSFYGHPSSAAIAFSLVDFIFNLILGIVGGIFYITRKK